jgi:hypothetical protein
MASIRSVSVRAVSFLLLFGFLAIQSELPAVGVESSDTVTVTAQIVEPTPACPGSDSPVSFLPSVQYSSLSDPIYIQLPDSTSDFAYVDLNIMDGQTEDCDTVTAYVTFSESGFKDSSSQPATFLSTVFDCDSSALTADGQGIYTCQGGASSPTTITMTVEAGQGAVQGYYTNVLSIDLIANP